MSYPLTTWTKARLDYENGTVRSVDELAKKYGMSTTAIFNKISSEFWVKGERAEEVKKSIQQRFAEELEKKIGIGYLIDKVKELMEATDSVMMGDKELGKQKNWTAIAAGLKEANKILGSYAPVKQEVDIKVEVVKYVDAVVRGLNRVLPDDIKDRAIDAVFQELECVK